MVGTIEEYPTKADAQKASEHLRLTANSDNPRARTLTFGALLDRYERRKCQGVTLPIWRIGLTSKRTSGLSGQTCRFVS